MSNLAEKDIVQITNPENHWYPAFVVVTEVRAWGVLGYGIFVTSNDKKDANHPYPTRLRNADFVKVGTAVEFLD